MGDSDMLFTVNKNVIVECIAAAANKWQSLEDAISIYGADDNFNIEKFKKSTGVNGRYIANEYQTASDFCFAAAERILQNRSIDREEIGALVFVSQFPDYDIPATACVLHKRLNLSKACIAFDINLGCSGFVYGVNVASSILSNSNKKYALVLCGDTSVKDKSRGREQVNGSHSNLYLFGDGGTATLLSRCEGSNISTLSCSDGNGFDLIMKSDHSWRHPWSNAERKLDDVEVFNFSISEAPKMIKDYMYLVNKTPDDYDALVLHQANKFIMNTVCKRAGFDQNKNMTSIEKFANTSSASIPNTLVYNWGGDDSEEKKTVLCCGFGVGLSWGAVELKISPSQVLPLIHTDEWFDDGLPEE